MTGTWPTAESPVVAPMLTSGVIAVVRLGEAVPLGTAAEALAAGGIGAIEITLTTPGALDIVRELASAGIPNCVIGAGTVLDEAVARQAIAAGARLIVSPVFEPGILRICRERNVVYMPGGFTPTELLRAWNAGATMVKVFPAASLGVEGFRQVLAPLPQLRLVPSGGVTLENAGEWIKAGATAISVGTALVNAARVRREALDELSALARRYVDAVAGARRLLADSA